MHSQHHHCGGHSYRQNETWATEHAQLARHAFHRINCFDKQQQYHWLACIKSTVDINSMWMMRPDCRPWLRYEWRYDHRPESDACSPNWQFCHSYVLVFGSSITIIICIVIVLIDAMRLDVPTNTTCTNDTSMYSKCCKIDWWALQRIHSVFRFLLSMIYTAP